MIAERYKFSILTLLFLLFVGPILGEEQEQGEGFWGNYKILVDRNIFSRNRGRASERDSGEAKEVVVPAPESYFVLKGISQQGSERIAFFEDSRTGKTTRARIGEAVAQGKIKNITLDNVEYELNGKLTKTEVGKNLEGEVSSPPLTYNDLIESTAMSSEAPTASTPSAEKAQPGNEDEILKRLRERRQKELEK
jgi:hypothetical protein